MNVHAIGDKANRAVVDAFESVLGADCNACNDARRLRIEHAQIVVSPAWMHQENLHLILIGLASGRPEADQKDGHNTKHTSQDHDPLQSPLVLTTSQPTHATSDMEYASSRLGPERLTTSAYRMSSLFSPGLPVQTGFNGPVLGSDFPVEPPNPFRGMYAAVTRLSPVTGTSPSGDAGWYPEESLTVEQAILGFTRNAAYGWFKENQTGAIEVGKWADFVVVDMGLEDWNARLLRDVVVKETWVGGRRVYPEVGKVRAFNWDMYFLQQARKVVDAGISWVWVGAGNDL